MDIQGNTDHLIIRMHSQEPTWIPRITYNVELSLFKQCLQTWKIKDTYLRFFGKKVAMNITKITIFILICG